MEMLEAVVPELQGVAGDIMTSQVHTAHEGTSVAEVATTMTKNKIRRVIVIDDDRRVIGVISQRDILRYCLRSDDNAGSFDGGLNVTPIRSLIESRHPITVLPDVPLIRAATVLAANKVGCLPVVDAEGALVGILTVTDFLRHLTGDGEVSVDTEFKFFAPSADARSKTPAYIRRMNGDVVVPIKCLEFPERLTRFVQLGYDEARGRVLIKTLPENESCDGAQKVLRDKEHIVIQASDFVAHFGLGGKVNTFNVESLQNGRYLVLTPRPPS